MSKVAADTHNFVQRLGVQRRPVYVCLACGKGAYWPKLLQLTCDEVRARHPDLLEWRKKWDQEDAA